MSKVYYGVTDHKDIIRDADNKALLNKDVSSLNKYKEDRDYKLKLAKVVDDHEQLKDDMSLMKQMLQEILGKLK